MAPIRQRVGWLCRSVLRCAGAVVVVTMASCGSQGTDAIGGPANDGTDPENECAACSGKADGWTAPGEGTCEAAGMLRVANTTSLEELVSGAKLSQTTAAEIVQRRESDGEFSTLEQLDAVPYVGVNAFKALLAYAEELGYTQGCAPGTQELGLVSDLDLTVIPEHKNSYPEVAAYPGVGKLYGVIEFRGQGIAGDVFYVTARVPARVVDIPAWLEQNGVPSGRIETGTSGIPWVAQREKIKDITAVMQERTGQKFVLFGDTSQRDPEVYRQIMTDFPDRVAAAMIHKVTDDVPAERVDGMHLFDNYVQAAAILCGLGVLDRDEGESVMSAAREQGLNVSDEEFDALVQQNTP
jgi:hypothetical protein